MLLRYSLSCAFLFGFSLLPPPRIFLTKRVLNFKKNTLIIRPGTKPWNWFFSLKKCFSVDFVFDGLDFPHICLAGGCCCACEELENITKQLWCNPNTSEFSRVGRNGEHPNTCLPAVLGVHPVDTHRQSGGALTGARRRKGGTPRGQVCRNKCFYFVFPSKPLGRMRHVRKLLKKSAYLQPGFSPKPTIFCFTPHT